MFLQDLSDRFLGAIPNVLAAILILILGFVVALLAQFIVVKLIKMLNLDEKVNKLGIKDEDTGSTVSFIGKLVFAIVFLLFLPAVFSKLGMESVAAPISAMVTSFVNFIPNIIAAVILLAIGLLLAKLIGTLVATILNKVGADSFVERTLPADKKSNGFSFSKLIGSIVSVLIALFFMVEAFNALDLQVLKNIGAVIIAYIPSVIGAIAIALVAFFLAQWAGQLLEKQMGKGLVPTLVKGLIYGVASFMILEQLGLANQIVTKSFTYLILGLALAFALAFGLGGRDFAARSLKKMEDSVEGTPSAPNGPQNNENRQHENRY